MKFHILLCTILSTSLLACGGGGPSGSTTPTVTSTTQENNTNTPADNSATDSNAVEPSEAETGPASNAVSSREVAPGIALLELVAGDKMAHLLSIDVDALTAPATRLFDDNATFVDLESYNINMRQLIDVTPIDGQLQISNWLPRDLHNVVLAFEHEGKRYTALHIKHLPGSARFSIDLPATLGATHFADEARERVLEGKNSIDNGAEFFLQPQDDVQSIVAGINLDWKIRFPDRVMNGNADVCRDANVVWRPTRPQDARYLMVFMIHAAQTVSDPRFYDFWMKTPFMSYDGEKMSAEYVLTEAELNEYSAKERSLYDQTSLHEGLYYNKAHRQMVFNKYYEKTFALGLTGGGGLGGGSTVGVNHNKIIELIWDYQPEAVEAGKKGDWYLDTNHKFERTAWPVFGHETGHALGFSHQQTYTVRDRFSHVTVGAIVYSLLAEAGETLITPDTMVGRDTEWELPYNKKANASERSRPRCGDAYEWGGSWGKHDYVMPQKDTPEWETYIEEHLKGKGLAYLQSLNLDQSQYYDWITPRAE